LKSVPTSSPTSTQWSWRNDELRQSANPATKTFKSSSWPGWKRGSGKPRTSWWRITQNRNHIRGGLGVSTCLMCYPILWSSEMPNRQSIRTMVKYNSSKV
jgi:hypothetical protein